MGNPNTITYIVTGANGFIGRNLLRQLNGNSVIAIGRSTKHDPVAGEKYYSIQEYTLGAIARELPPADYVLIDLAYTSISKPNAENPGVDFADNINLVIDNLKFARDICASRYVYVSTGGAIYGSSADLHIDERHITNPISHYGIIKLASEKYVTMFCPIHKMEFVIVRPSNVYGPGQIPFRGQGIVATALGSGLKQRPVTIFGKGDNVRDYIYIDDCTRWLVEISRHGENRGIYNAGSGEGHSLMDVITLVQDELAGRDHRLILEYLPDRPFDVKRNVLDNNKIIGCTGLRPAMSLRAGIEQTCSWVEEYLITQKQPVDGNY